MKQQRGYTLVEILAAVTIFSATIGTLFSVIAALRRTDAFRDNTMAVTQAANYAFEPIIRSVKAAGATELLRTNTGCVMVRGYYGQESSGYWLNSIIEGKPYAMESGKLITLDQEKVYEAGKGQVVRWVKKEYAREEVSDGVFTIRERTYHSLSVWPNQLGSQAGTPPCLANDALAWNGTATTDRQLTGPEVTVDTFSVSLVAPVVKPAEDTSAVQNAPYATITVTVKPAKQNDIRPVTLTTTVTPTFSYGEQRD